MQGTWIRSLLRKLRGIATGPKDLKKEEETKVWVRLTYHYWSILTLPLGLFSRKFLELRHTHTHTHTHTHLYFIIMPLFLSIKSPKECHPKDRRFCLWWPWPHWGGFNCRICQSWSWNSGNALFRNSPKGREAPRFLLTTIPTGTSECLPKAFLFTHLPHPLLPYLQLVCNDLRPSPCTQLCSCSSFMLQDYRVCLYPIHVVARLCLCHPFRLWAPA